MLFPRLRRTAGPLGLLLTLVYVSSLLPAVAWAEALESPESEMVSFEEWSAQLRQQAAAELEQRGEKLPAEAATAPVETGAGEGEGAAGDAPLPSLDPNAPAQLAGLPTGADKSGVTSQVVSLPKGEGSVQGMGESFSAQMSTGGLSYSVPFALPKARGAVSMSLGLAYQSGGGHGIAGQGWSVGVPFIARQTDRGVPSYDDRTDWHPEQDRFVFNGGQELVPLCTIRGGGCAPQGAGSGGLLADGTRIPVDERFPAWAEGWQYFRPRVEGSFQRFFWSPGHGTWRVQAKSGVILELGVPGDDAGYGEALERNPEAPTEIYRWHLVRQFDTYGTVTHPNNVVVYRYEQEGGVAHLSDIYATPPLPSPGQAELSAYAHHVRLVYEPRRDSTQSYRAGWLQEETLRLARVDVASMPSSGGARAQVRRYHLGYDASSYASLLTSVQLEGRCASGVTGPALAAELADSTPEEQAPRESGELLPEFTACPRLPAMTFGYQHVTGYDTQGRAAALGASGFEPIDARLQTLAQSPDHSVDEALTDLFDINSDGLPDVLVTAPGLYGGGHGWFELGAGGVAGQFGPASPMSVVGAGDETAAVIKLSNANLVPLDLDGDGHVNLLHMPRTKSYSIFDAVGEGGVYHWQGRRVATANAQDARIDFTQDALETRVMDVNGDGLSDVVVGTGTALKTYFSLGRYAGGDGQFGEAQWTGATTAALSLDPQLGCIPHAGTPVRFSEAGTKVADMNGDGLPDIVRLRQGDLRYWPGRGNGQWGTGTATGCEDGGFAADREVSMEDGPRYSDIEGNTLRLDDVNGDGLADLVQVRLTAVDLWYNLGGAGWSAKVTIDNTPPSPSYADRVRLVDVNGSGTLDILWGTAGSYRFLDVAGGRRPLVLTSVQNGLGATTTIEYGSSSDEMLAAERRGPCRAGGDPWAMGWCSKMPLSVQLVKRTTTTNHLPLFGQAAQRHVTEYEYRDPVYEGRQREFRGFRRARSRTVGDANSPSNYSESQYLLGECRDETAANGVDDCSLGERWRDNPREALKGLPVISETYDETGRYLSSAATHYALRELYRGLDGRAVRHAVATSSRAYSYDTGAWRPGALPESFPAVSVETLGSAAPGESVELVQRSQGGTARVEGYSTVDYYGNGRQSVALGCTSCSPVDEAIVSETVPVLVGDWLWRSGESWVRGRDGEQRKHSRSYYDSHGQVILTEAHLFGSEALQRAGRVAAPGAISDGWWEQSRATYDAVTGAPVRSEAAGQRCAEVRYDSQFGDVALEETAYLDGCPSANPASRGLTTTVTLFDRGLGAVVAGRSFNGRSTRTEYDSFGRVTAQYLPHTDPQRALSPLPSVWISYDLATPQRPYSIVTTHAQQGAALDVGDYAEAAALVDGLGRTLVTLTEADRSAGDDGSFVVSGAVRLDAKGKAREKFVPFFTDATPGRFPLGARPRAPSGTERYDAFGRGVQIFDIDGTMTMQTRHHALSVDMWDAADLQSGPHQGSYATTYSDGHGRGIDVVERVHVNGVLEERHVLTSYLPSGEVASITRRRGNDASTAVTRWMRYDSFGRMVLNVDPHTSVGDAGPGTASPVLRAWRYAYDAAGELVGTSDARRCGQNFYYDRAGRVLGEDYVPCESWQPAYTNPGSSVHAPDVAALEVRYLYDALPAEDALTPSPGGTAALDALVAPYRGVGSYAGLLRGTAVGMIDRGRVTYTLPDGRGQTLAVLTRVARPEAHLLHPQRLTGFAGRFAEGWAQRRYEYDAGGREVAATTGAESPELQGSDGASLVRTTYSRRGTVSQVAGSYGVLVRDLKRSADGRMLQLSYGDLAGTTTAYGYDDRRRVANVITYRGAPGEWGAFSVGVNPPLASGAAPNTQQLLLQDEDYAYDVVGNPIEIRDHRLPEEWPAGAKPVSRRFEYDDSYRVIRQENEYEGGADPWTSPWDSELRGEGDDRRPKPMPQVEFAERSRWSSFRYDWLGNNEQTDDDAHGFWDRSVGNTTAVAGKPYQLASAAQSAGTRGGFLRTTYDDAGNLVALNVSRQGPCLGGQCGQLFRYRWDEVGRLVQAKRWDVAPAQVPQSAPALGGADPTGPPAASLSYLYDGSDSRVLKTAEDAVGEESHTVYLLPGLELRSAGFDAATVRYERNRYTENAYLTANGVPLARLAWEEPGIPTLGFVTVPRFHVYFELADHLGSANLVIDQETGELVERATYGANGTTESDYRPERWGAYRANYRFTGKEEDAEVGLIYFGKRFLSPQLGRWVSPDPLAVHAPGQADLNLYAYVKGALLRAVDPVGLADVFVVSDKLLVKWMAETRVSYRFSNEFFLELEKLKEEMGVEREVLAKLMYTESGLDPKANLYKEQTAKGLCQWMRPDHAMGLVSTYNKSTAETRAFAVELMKGTDATVQVSMLRTYWQSTGGGKRLGVTELHARFAGASPQYRRAATSGDFEGTTLWGDSTGCTGSGCLSMSPNVETAAVAAEYRAYHSNLGLDGNGDGRTSMAEFRRFAERGDGVPIYEAFMKRWGEVVSESTVLDAGGGVGSGGADETDETDETDDAGIEEIAEWSEELDASLGGER